MNGNGDDIPVPAGFARSLVQQIWDRYVEGYSAHEISEQFSIALDRVDQLLMERHQERRDLRHQQPDFYRDADCARVDRLLQTYLPISLMDELVLEKVRSGEPVHEQDGTHPLHCGVFVLQLLKYRCELLGLRIGVDEKAVMTPGELLEWLQKQVAVVEKVVAEAPKDFVELPEVTSFDGSGGDLELESDHDLDQPPSVAAADLGELDLDLPTAPPPPVSPPKTNSPVENDEREQRKQRWLNGQPDGL